MNTERLQEKLIAAARRNPPSDHVPFAFEQRIMAQLRRPALADASTFWAIGLWRAVLPSVALLGLVGGLHLNGVPEPDLASEVASTADELDRVMLGALEPNESW